MHINAINPTQCPPPQDDNVVSTPPALLPPSSRPSPQPTPSHAATLRRSHRRRRSLDLPPIAHGSEHDDGGTPPSGAGDDGSPARARRAGDVLPARRRCRAAARSDAASKGESLLVAPLKLSTPSTHLYFPSSVAAMTTPWPSLALALALAPPALQGRHCAPPAIAPVRRPLVGRRSLH